MKKNDGIKNGTIIVLTVAVVIILFMVRFLISDDLGIKKNNKDNEIDNSNNNTVIEEEIEKITLDDPIVKELINLLGKTEGSLIESKNIGSSIATVEELMYYVSNSDVSRLDKDIIMYLILNNANITEVSDTFISVSPQGVGYEVGYIIENSEVQRVMSRIFGSNLTIMPIESTEVGVYFINIEDKLVSKYARYNFATGNIELSLDNVITNEISNYLYLNCYDRVEISSDDVLDLYEKVIFTSSVLDKDNGFKLYKDVMHTEYIAKVNNYDLVNGRYRFSEKELNNYINLFAEYKYTFNKDSNGYYHLKNIQKVH